MTVTRRHSDGPYFRLSGTRFTVNAQPREGMYSGVPIAFVTSVTDATGLGRWEPVKPAVVQFVEVDDEPLCDLDELCTIFDAGLKTVQRRRQALEQARNRLGRRQTEATPHTDMHATVRRRYQALLLVLTLLERRSELERAVSAVGEAAQIAPADDGDGNVLWVRLGKPAAFVEGRPVVVTPADGRRRELRVHTVEEDEALLAVSEPPEKIAPGTAVRLEQQGRFPLGKHQTALKRFLGEDVEGNWIHLAQLLCEPARLPVVGLRPPARFFDRSLNDEQRAAVTGAVASPHAFFVQGPPGTGKSTVIAEAVRQLLDRGERVLLLAPMHVAVDEVLGQVADKPGVFALRISWDEGRVRQDLKRYLPERVSHTYLRDARKPATSKAGQWQQEIIALRSEADAVGEYLADRRQEHQLTVDLAYAERGFEQWRNEVAAAMVEADSEHSNADRRLQEARLATLVADSQAASLRRQLDGTPLLRRLWARVCAAFGQANELARRTEAWHRAALHARHLEREQYSWAARLSATRDQLAALHSRRTTEEPRHEEAIRALRAGLSAIRRKLPSGAELLRAQAGQNAKRMGIGDLTAWHDRLTGDIRRREQRIDLEQRWFELSGLATGTEDGLAKEFDADLRRSANLICATTTGINRDLGDAEFDTLIVDEASRVVDSEFLIGAVRARRWILVGDEKQLPPYVEPADEQHLHAMCALHAVDRNPKTDLDAAVARLGELWDEDEELHQFRADAVLRTAQRLRDSGAWRATYQGLFAETWQRLGEMADPEMTLLAAMRDHLVRSLFERTVTQLPAMLRQRLREQWRMIEPIALLVRDPVYRGDYVTARASRLTPLRHGSTGKPILLVNTETHGAKAREQLVGNGFVNDKETELVVSMCRAWERRLRDTGAEPVSTSILTFYRRQAAGIRSALGGPPYRDFQLLNFRVIDAIDKIQGQEADLVFLSFVRTYLGKGKPSSRYGRWLQDIRRLNVAFTRARRGLILVGHKPTLRALHGVPAAEEFYRNLFTQFDAQSDMEIVSDAG
jgi:hypothetical protein